tara:strand:- start:143 stop:328 length:186 start_codon:yes stop_codon:yes gene_type:complete
METVSGGSGDIFCKRAIQKQDTAIFAGGETTAHCRRLTLAAAAATELLLRQLLRSSPRYGM